MGLGDLFGEVWDGAKASVDVAWHAMPNVAIAGFALDVATAPWNDDEEYNGFVNTLQSRFATRLGDFLEPIDLAAMQGDEAALDWLLPKLHRAYSYGVSRTLGTVNLTVSGMAGGENANTGPGNDLLGNLPTFADVRRHWNSTRDISVGQTAYNVYAGTTTRAARKVGVPGIPGVSLGGLSEADFDITDPGDRQRAFRDNGLGMVSTGLADGAARWYLDPTVLGLQGIGLARRAAVVKPIRPGDDLDAILAPKYGDGGIKDRATRPFDAQRRVTSILDDLAAKTPAQRMDWLARNKTFMPNAGIQHLLAQADTADDMRAILRVGVDGSEKMMRQLSNQGLHYAERMKVLSDVRIPSIERTLATERFGDLARANPQLRATFEAEKVALNNQLAVAREAELFFSHLQAVAGTLREVPRVTLGQRMTSARPTYDTLNWGGPSWATYQPTRYGTATRVLKSAGTRRPQTVDFNRSGSGTEASKRFLDRVGHGFERDFIPAKGFSHRGVDPVVKGALLAEVARAEALFAAGKAPQSLVENAIANVEKTALEHYGRAFDLDAAAVRALYEETVARRLQFAGEKGISGKERYSAVPRPEEPGRFLDEVDANGTGEFIVTPMTTSQFKDTMPMLDIDTVARVMARHGDALRGENAKHFISRLHGSPSAATTYGVVDEALTKFNRIWKPTQLMRLGWPLRVITDEQFRVIATVGILTHLPLAMQSTAASLAETRAAYRVRDAATSADRLEARHGLAQQFPAKAADLERVTLVDKIADIDMRTADLDRKIAAAGQRLREAGKANEGTRLYVAAPERARLKASAPRGVRYEVDDAGRMHGPQRNNQAVHARLGLEISDDAVYLTNSRHADPGVAALEDLLPAPQYAALAEKTNAELRVILQREVGPNVSLARYKTREELLSVYGATLARRQGYKALYHAPGEQASFTALTDDAARLGDEAAFGKAADEMERLRITRDTLAAQRQSLTGREAALPQWTGQMQAEWDDLMARAVKPSKMRKAEGPRRKFAGERSYLAANGQQIGYQDAFGGQGGQVYMDLSSARSTVRSLAGLQDRYVNGLRLRTGEHKFLGPRPADDATPTMKDAHAKSYARSWERAVNDQLGKNVLGQKLLAGMTDDQAVAWLRHSREGRNHREQHPVRGSDPRRWVEEVRMQIEQYLPTPALRAAAAEGKATISMLEREIPKVDARPIIHGESLELATGAGHIAPLMDKVITAFYDKIGTAPTDVLSRHPFFTAHYRTEMKRQIDVHLANTTTSTVARTSEGLRGGPVQAGKTTVNADDIERFQRKAREHALRKTRETLYDVANSSNLAHTFRFVSPFYAAWQDALTTWGRLWMEDPSRLARMAAIWQAPSKSFMETYDDPTSGKTYAVLPLPDYVKKHLPVTQGDMPTDFFKGLIMQGDYWMVPGSGAPINVGMQELTRQRPDLYELMKPLIPYGAGETVLDDVLPAGWRRAKTSWSKEDDYSWASAYQRNTVDVYYERSIGRNDYTDEEMYAEAVRRTKDFYRVRTWANFTLPYSAKFKSEHQFWYDQAAAMREQYASYPKGKDPGGKNWEEAWIDKYGEDYFIFTTSLTKSNIGGVPATTAGFKATKKYADLIAANPEYGGLIVGPEAYGDEFNSEVFQHQRNNPVGGGDTRPQRELRSPEETIKEAEIARGWDRYRRIDTAIDNELAARGLRSINAKAAADLKALKDITVGKIAKELPAWGEARLTFTRGKAGKLVSFLEENIDEAPFVDRPYQRTLAEYLAKRRVFVSVLKTRQSQNLQARENDDVRVLWEMVVNKLRQSDTEFADMHSRYLSNDDRLDDEGAA